MIPLFNVPNHNIRTGLYDNFLHGKIVTKFENKFCEYIEAPNGVSISSASVGIFLTCTALNDLFKHFYIPGIIPPVVPTHLKHANINVNFVDNVKWVGNSYILYEDSNTVIIDSAQEVLPGSFSKLPEIYGNKRIIVIYSFYPTKPVGSMDGGLIASNDQEFLKTIRSLSRNGMSSDIDSWDRSQKYLGWKMYMNSAQADLALKNLRKFDEKRARLDEIRHEYNEIFKGLYPSDYYDNGGYHLYRIHITNREKTRDLLKEKGISTGIHYMPTYKMKVFKGLMGCAENMELSELVGKHALSLPFNEELTTRDIRKITENVGSIVSSY